MKLSSEKSTLRAIKSDPEKSSKRLRVLTIKYFYPCINVLMLLTLLAIFVFLYYNAYLSIGHAQHVAQLKQQILEEDLKTDDLAKTIKALETKEAGTNLNWSGLKDPFKRNWVIEK